MWCLCLVLVSEWWWPHKISWQAFLPLQVFWNNFRRVSVSSYLNFQCSLLSKYLIKFACEAIRSWNFVLGKVFNHSFNFSACDWSVHVFYFYPGLVFEDYTFLRIVYFFQVVYFIGIQLSIVVSGNLLYCCGVNCNLSFFMSNFTDLCPLPFFLDEFN